MSREFRGSSPWIVYIRAFIKATKPCLGCENEECSPPMEFSCPALQESQEDEERIERLFQERVKSRGLRLLSPGKEEV